MCICKRELSTGDEQVLDTSTRPYSPQRRIYSVLDFEVREVSVSIEKH